MDKRHLLICGERGAGKSTLIRRLLEESDLRAAGFVTVRESKADENGCFPVYLHPAAKERRCGKENLVGLIGGSGIRRFPEVFDTLGAACIRDSGGDVLVMDELGFLEDEAEEFQAAALRALEGDKPVIAALKAKKTPFLDAVRASGKALVVTVDESNRDALFSELLPFVRAWARQEG